MSWDNPKKTTCSKVCMKTKQVNVAKINNVEKYGVENPMQVDEFRAKARQTSLDRYGVEHHITSESIKSKAKQTNLERYGVECASQ